MFRVISNKIDLQWINCQKFDYLWVGFSFSMKYQVNLKATCSWKAITFDRGSTLNLLYLLHRTIRQFYCNRSRFTASRNNNNDNGIILYSDKAEFFLQNQVLMDYLQCHADSGQMFPLGSMLPIFLEPIWEPVGQFIFLDLHTGFHANHHNTESMKPHRIIGTDMS